MERLIELSHFTVTGGGVLLTIAVFATIVAIDYAVTRRRRR